MNRLILGYRPNGILLETCDIGESSTSRRLDSLYPAWRRDFDVVNLHWMSEDHPGADTEPSHMPEILARFSPDVIFVLGADCWREVMPASSSTKWLEGVSYRFEWTSAAGYSSGKDIAMVKFPHPSGRNRWWNDPDNCYDAATALHKSWHHLFEPSSASGPVTWTPTSTVFFPSSPTPRGGVLYKIMRDKLTSGEIDLSDSVVSITLYDDSGVELSEHEVTALPAPARSSRSSGRPPKDLQIGLTTSGLPPRSLVKYRPEPRPRGVQE